LRGHRFKFHLVRVIYIYIYIYILFVKQQLGFNPVAVVQQYNRQVTDITHKESTNTTTQYKNTTINDTTTANTTLLQLTHNKK
jgi:hypothetical protein